MTKAINFNKTGSLTYKHSVPAFGNNFTIDVWLKLNSLTHYNFSTLFMRGNSYTANGVHIFNNKLGFRRSTSGDLGNELEPISNLEINKWYRLTFVYASRTMKYYRDGKVIKTIAGFTGDFPTETEISFGDWYAQYGAQLDGAIHDFKFFNRALNEEELKMLFNNRTYEAPFKDSLILQLKYNDVTNHEGMTLYGSIKEDVFLEYHRNKTLILHDGEYKKWNPKIVGGYKSIIPKMTSNNSPNGIVEASSNYGGAYAEWRAFDKITNAHTNGSWHTGGKAPQWISYESTEAKCVRKLSITARLDSLISSQGVKDFSLEGYNESTGQWEIVYSKTGEVSWTIGEVREFEFDNSKKYKKHRLYITATTGTTAFAITEIDFLEALIGGEEEWTIEDLSNIGLNGMDSLSPLLDRRVETLEPLTMKDKSEILKDGEVGKVFSAKLDLKKYMDIRSIEVEVG